MKRAALFSAVFVTALAGLGVFRARLGGGYPGAGGDTDKREVLKVGFLPVT